MSVITKMRKQTAVYWAPGAFDNYGRPLALPPIQIACRWDDANEQYLDKNGNMQMSQAIVYPDRQLAFGGILWKGLITGIVSGSPFNNPYAWEIAKLQAIPNFRNTEILYIVHIGERTK